MERVPWKKEGRGGESGHGRAAFELSSKRSLERAGTFVGTLLWRPRFSVRDHERNVAGVEWRVNSRCSLRGAIATAGQIVSRPFQSAAQRRHRFGMNGKSDRQLLHACLYPTILSLSPQPEEGACVNTIPREN